MKRTLILILFTLLFLPVSEITAEVKIPYKFKSGEVAKASEVNENFATLKEAIEQLQKRIAELETKNKALEQENSDLKKRVDELEIALKKRSDGLETSSVTKLRSTPGTFSEDEIKSMVKNKGFRESTWNPNGNFPNEYEAKTLNGDKVVIDHTTGLMWQQSGSSTNMAWEKAQDYVNELNEKHYAGYSDWRLPTIEEFSSLLEPQKKNGTLYVNPVFDARQSICWSADRYSSDGAWSINFLSGYVNPSLGIMSSYSVRLVRSIQQPPKRKPQTL